MRCSTRPTSRKSASPNSWPARSLTSLKSSQSRTTRLSSLRSLLGATELALEQILEPAPVVEARERIGVRAAALAVERDRRVERRRGVRGEERCQLTLATVELPREAAGADEQADLLAVRPQRNQHHRAELQAGELGHRHRGRVEQLEHGRCVDARAQRPQRVDAATARAPGAVALHSVDSTSCPSSSSSSSWLVSTGSTRPSERTATSAIALRVAERAHVDEEASERREIRCGSRAARPSARPATASELGDRVIAARRKRLRSSRC